MTFLKNKKIHIRNIIFSILTYIAFLIYFKSLFNSKSYDILVTFIYFLILIFYYKYDISSNKRARKFSIILALIISILLSIGNTVYPVVYNKAVNIFNLKNTIYTIVCILGLFLFFTRIFYLMFTNLNKIKMFENKANTKFDLKLFFIFLIIILICWTPYFLRYFPAIMTSDSYYVIHYANEKILSDFHTFRTTWFFGIFFHLGKLLFNNMNAAVALSTIVQMLLMASIFSYSIIYLRNKGINKFFCIICLLIYSLSPLHAHYSITLWRDIVFGGAFVLLFTTLYEFVTTNKKIKNSTIFLFIISILLILFFRNNGIYICILLLPFILFSKISYKKMISIVYIIILTFYFIIKGPIFDYFNIEKSTTIEAFSIPLQQIARTISLDKKIDEKDRIYLSQIMNTNLIKERYASAISDPIKNLTNNQKLSQSKGKFITLWFKYLVKYPKVYFEAYFTQTLGYWYPNVEYWATGMESKSIFEDINVYSDPITSNNFNKVIDLSTLRKIPFSNLIWSCGTTTFILIISSFIFIYNNKVKYILPYIPLYLLLFSILISTPVFSELRYVYGIFACVPLLLTIPFLKIKN